MTLYRTTLFQFFIIPTIRSDHSAITLDSLMVLVTVNAVLAFGSLIVL